MSVSVCPICGGKGTVSNDFYEDDKDTTHATFQTSCKACFGRGVIITNNFEKKNIEINPSPPQK